MKKSLGLHKIYFLIMKNILIVTIIAVFAFSCGKYEEGPGLSLASKTARLVNTWEVEKVIENGIDITTRYNTMYPDLTIKYMKNNSILQIENKTELAKAWEWGEDKETVIITWELLEVKSVQINKILRLTSKEYWYSTTLNGKSYIFHLKKHK